MASRRTILKTPLALLPLALPAVTRAQEATQLVVWHDMGDPGTKWFNNVSTAFAQSHPGVTIRAISYPTDQWFGRVVGALNTDTAPDLIFNNYERVIRIATQTGKVMDLKPVLASIADKAFIGEDDLRVATYRDRMIILPVQRVQMAFGVRTSWLNKVGESFPKTWDDAKRAAMKFQTEDPAGTGRGRVFGFALEAAHPRDLIHMLDLFTFGAGLRHTLLAPDGSITIDEPEHAQVLEEFLKIFTTYKLVPPDTINYSFNEMYQVIEGGRTGMFRVGDWNVGKWTTSGIMGDFNRGPMAAILPRQAERRGDRRHARGRCARKCTAQGTGDPSGRIPARKAGATGLAEAGRECRAHRSGYGGPHPAGAAIRQAGLAADCLRLSRVTAPMVPGTGSQLPRQLLAAIAAPPRTIPRSSNRRRRRCATQRSPYRRRAEPDA